MGIKLLGSIELFNTFSDICSPSLWLIPEITLIMIVYTQHSRPWYYLTSPTDWCASMQTFFIVILINIASCLNSITTNCIPASLKMMLRSLRYAFIYIKQSYSHIFLPEMFYDYSVAWK